MSTAKEITVTYRIINFLKLLVCIGAFLVIGLGCTARTITTPSGLTYKSFRLMTDSAVDEVTYDPSTGAITVKGVRSEQSKALDVALEALRKAP